MQRDIRQPGGGDHRLDPRIEAGQHAVQPGEQLHRVVEPEGPGVVPHHPRRRARLQLEPGDDPRESGPAPRAAHSRSATRICLETRGGCLHLTVSDDGAGYDTGSTPMGSGQRNMADRLAALDGSLEVRAAPSQGTTITAQLPLR
ncbi:MAG: hypothetical protein ABJB47_04090 [Actinomycetota bacterium]